jgi:hypothetical protein
MRKRLACLLLFPLLLASGFGAEAQPAPPQPLPPAPAAAAAPVAFKVSVSLPETLAKGELELRPYPSARERALFFLRGEESKPVQSLATGGTRRDAGFDIPFGFWLLTWRDGEGRRLETALTPLETPRDLGSLAGGSGAWRLRVVDGRGAPVAGARVGLLPQRIGQAVWRPALRPLETDEDGRVSLPLPSPRAELWVLAPGFAPLAATYQLGDFPAQVRLVAKASQPLQVVDSRRRPLGDALLSSFAGQPLGFTDAAGLASGPFAPGDLLWIEDAAGRRYRERVLRLRSGKLRMQLGSPSSLAGEVVDRRAGGRRVPGALVWLDGRPETWRQAGADGAFELFDLEEERSGAVLVTAQAAGYSRAMAPAGDAALVLALSRADRVLLGRVSGDDGEPLAGARVEVLSRGGQAAWSTRSDEDGQYRLEGLPAGELWAEASQPGRLAEVRPLHRSFAEIRLDFTLAAGSLVSGRLISPRGEPLAAVSLSALRSASEEPRPLGTTGADGAFEIGPLAAGKHRLLLAAAGFARRELAIEPNGAEPLDLGDLELADEEAFAGRVTGEDGEPLAEAAIFVWRGEDRRGLLLEWPAWRSPDAVSGADGRFALSGLAAGETLGIEVRAPGRPPIFEPGVVAGDSGERDFVVALGASLDIEVVDSARDPVAGVEVTLARLGVDPFENWQITDQGGKVAYPALAAGPFELRLASESYGVYRRRIELEAGDEENLQVVLGEEGSTLEGRVFLPDGQPAAGLKVFVDTGERISPPPVSTRIDELGFYHLEGLPSGKVAVEVSGRGAYAPIFRRHLRLELPQHQLDIELPESSARELEIEVFSEDGRPLEGVGVTIYYKTRRGGPIANLSRRTNAEGLALFAEVPATTYEVVAWAPDASWRSAEARVRLDVPRKQHRLVLAQTGETPPLD